MPIKNNEGRTRAEISLDNLAHNYGEVKRRVGSGTKVMCIIKADAYGHGAVPLAKELELLGADFFGVASGNEAIQLRANGIKTPILVLGPAEMSFAAVCIRENFSAVTFGAEHAWALSSAAVLAGGRVKTHIKVDTGMCRLGIPHSKDEERAAREIVRICALPGIEVEGLFSHFAASDDPKEESFTLGQAETFRRICQRVAEAGYGDAIKHCANSGAVIQYPCTYFDMVRPGLMLYGAAPSAEAAEGWDLRPVMELKARILQTKEIDAGDTVSYGRTYKAADKQRIAVVSIGYADGYVRAYSGTARMLVRGKLAPVIGRVCMDMCMLDVTHIPEAMEGDVVTVFGRDGDAYYSVHDLCRGTPLIPYETFCLVGKRVPRIYYKGGAECLRASYF